MQRTAGGFSASNAMRAAANRGAMALSAPHDYCSPSKDCMWGGKATVVRALARLAFSGEWRVGACSAGQQVDRLDGQPPVAQIDCE